jgi:hypothetical protein
MQTMAAAISSPHQALCKVLYRQTRQMLGALNWQEQEAIRVEQIQAELLLAHYEHLRVDERRAMITAGRAFRLVQVSRLYEIDLVEDVVFVSMDTMGDSFAEAEGKRRTFWVAFAFDRFLVRRTTVR